MDFLSTLLIKLYENPEMAEQSPFYELWNYGSLFKLFRGGSFSEVSGALLTLGGFIFCMIIPYLLGSINPSIIISSKKYKDDIRNHGSGNAGMTNVMRTYGKKMAALTFTCDFLKAVVSSLVGRLILGYIGAYLAGLFCFLGHIFPCYYKFKGGKGVVTACGMILMTDVRAFGILFLMFILIVAVTKFVSLGSVVGMLLYPIVLDRLGVRGISVLIAFLMAVLCAFAHRSNIVRLWNGTESKLSFKSKKKTQEEVSEE